MRSHRTQNSNGIIPGRGKPHFMDGVVIGPGPLRGHSTGLQPVLTNVALSGLSASRCVLLLDSGMISPDRVARI